MNDRPEIASPRLSRRSVLLGAAVGAGAIVLGTGAVPRATAAMAPAATTLIRGADISWAPQMQAQGFTWRNASEMTALLDAAYNQVKTVSPNTTVCIHLAQPQKFASMQTFFDAYAGNGGRWDMWNSATHEPTAIMNGFLQA